MIVLFLKSINRSDFPRSISEFSTFKQEKLIFTNEWYKINLFKFISNTQSRVETFNNFDKKKTARNFIFNVPFR